MSVTTYNEDKRKELFEQLKKLGVNIVAGRYPHYETFKETESNLNKI